jgi:hypothetical protein
MDKIYSSQSNFKVVAKCLSCGWELMFRSDRCLRCDGMAIEWTKELPKEPVKEGLFDGN